MREFQQDTAQLTEVHKCLTCRTFFCLYLDAFNCLYTYFFLIPRNYTCNYLAEVKQLLDSAENNIFYSKLTTHIQYRTGQQNEKSFF